MKILLKQQAYPSLLNFSHVLLRVGLGLFMLTHGYPKLEKLLSGSQQFPDPLGIGALPSLILAVFAEVFCSALVALGLLTRYAVIPLIITMIVAAFVAHAGDPFGKREMALLYLLGYVVIFARGSGKFSLDQLFGIR
ncbi:MAG: DoxX family protein [Cryomorphaceae bacterium]|nr:MAG: DoxX family protein [Cryomorphaceae bacterium]